MNDKLIGMSPLSSVLLTRGDGQLVSRSTRHRFYFCQMVIRRTVLHDLSVWAIRRTMQINSNGKCTFLTAKWRFAWVMSLIRQYSWIKLYVRGFRLLQWRFHFYMFHFNVLQSHGNHKQNLH